MQENLAWAKARVEEVGGDFVALEKFGFESLRFDPTVSTINRVLVHAEKGVIVKRPFLRVDDDVPKCAVPTVIIPIAKSEEELRKEVSIYSRDDVSHFQNILIQPVVETSAQEDAYAEVVKSMSIHERRRYDLHQWNTGWYQGRAVLFDW